MNKSFIVTNIEYDKYLKTEKQIEDLDFKVDNAYGIWYGEGNNDDELHNDPVSYTHLTLPTTERV